MLLKSGRHPRAPERLRKTVRAEQRSRSPFKASRTSAASAVQNPPYVLI